MPARPPSCCAWTRTDSCCPPSRLARAQPDSRHAAGAARGRHARRLLRPQPLPLATPDLLAARAIRGELPFGKAATASDFRGKPVLGAVQPVPGTDWFLVAKIDRAELRAESCSTRCGSSPPARWRCSAPLVAFLQRERRALERSRAEQAEQDERLRRWPLMQAIAEGSNDAIFAKDRDGRYLLCNRDAGEMMAGPSSRCSATTTATLFDPPQAAVLMANDAQVMAQDRIGTYEEEVGTADGTAPCWPPRGRCTTRTGA